MPHVVTKQRMKACVLILHLTPISVSHLLNSAHWHVNYLGGVCLKLLVTVSFSLKAEGADRNVEILQFLLPDPARMPSSPESLSQTCNRFHIQAS